MTEALFDYEMPPVRKGAAGYEVQLAGGDYAGHSFWALAPVDRYVRENLTSSDVPAADVDFVWLVVDGRLVWALVNVVERLVIALDPAPVEKAVRVLFAKE